MITFDINSIHIYLILSHYDIMYIIGSYIKNCLMFIMIYPIIWYNYFKDRNITIVKVVYNINGTYVKEMEGNMLIITNYTNFSEVLNDYPHILEKYQNTLFIFHKVTWEEVILKDILFLH